MKTILCLFFICIQFVGLSQQITFEDDFTFNRWTLTTPTALIGPQDQILYFKTTSKGTSEMLSTMLVDYSKDFNISYDIIATGFFYMLLNQSKEGKNNFKISIANYGSEVTKNKNYKSKILNKQKFKPILERAGELHIDITQTNNQLLITLLDKATDETYTLFSDTYAFEPEDPLFGFALYQGEDEKTIGISNFKIQYHPYTPKGIRLLANYESFGEKLNLGKNINTKMTELGQKISADGNMLTYTRENGSSQVPYYTTFENGNWTEGRPISESLFPSDATNSVTSMTTDKNTLFINGKWQGDVRVKGISKIERTTTGWTTPTGIDIEGYETKGKFSNSISTDQRFIISSLDNDDSKGQDLFVFFRNEDGSYGKRLNLGATVNSEGAESTPFLAPDNKTLYFSSDGHLGYGSQDIFISRRLDDTWINWSEPENLGPKINTPEWDGHYCVSAKGDYAYMTTYWQTEGEADIARVELPQEAKPEKMIIIKGKVLNGKTREPIAAEIRFNDISTNVSPGVGNSDPNTGNYQVVLPYGKLFQLYAQKEGYYPLSDQIDLNDQGDFKIIEKDIFLSPVKVGEVFRLNNIFFETGSAELKNESNQELERLVKFLDDNPKIKIKIAGHTDNVGTESDNLTLSQKRAVSVAQFLKTAKISESRISSEGFGEGKPLESNDKPEGRSINRRVEFTIVSN